jgi:molecular chaperone GrpE
MTASSDLPPEPSPDALPPQDGTKLEPLAAAKKEAADNHDRYLRVAADLENFRRRTVREKDELRLYAASRVLEDILPALDNLALGLAATRQPKADLKTLTDGVEMVLQQLKSALANHGLKEINPAGQAFDPHQHEAISHQADAKVPAEHVLTVVRPGFSLNGRLLRPASVVISSGPEPRGGGKA